MSDVRIVSLLPSATDIVVSLGLGKHLVGRTHECDWPEEITSVPVMTKDVLATSSMSTRDIHIAISESVHSGSSIYELDNEALRDAKPDLILTQELCSVCAVSYSEVSSAVRVIDADATVVSLEPTSIGEILETILTVGELAGAAEEAEDLVSDLRRRLDDVKRAVAGKPRPRVASIEWLDPLFSAGHWVPEQVAAAGGNERVGQAGAPSSQIEWEAVTTESPEVLVLMPCGHDIVRAKSDLRLLSEQPDWYELPAVQQGEVWAVDGPSYFNRPGPRVVSGVEVLAGIFHSACDFTEEEAINLL
jgi:iron complex transport system substrate-binding protein